MICKRCKKEKKNYAKGLCKRCYSREYQKKNRERLRKYRRYYVAENKEKLRDYQKKYYRENKEKLREYLKEYRKKNFKKRRDQELKKGEGKCSLCGKIFKLEAWQHSSMHWCAECRKTYKYKNYYNEQRIKDRFTQDNIFKRR